MTSVEAAGVSVMLDRTAVLEAVDCAAGDGGWVEVRNDGTNGHVIADAVQFVPVKK